MNPSTSDYIAMLTRLDKNKVRESSTGTSTVKESALHDQIIAYCNSQWPKWKYIRARMDKRSTIAVGAQDFTLFLPGGRLLCVECKRAGEKPSPEQLAWHKEMEMLGHKVHVVYTFSEFLDVVDGKRTPAANSLIKPQDRQGVYGHPPRHESSPEAKPEGNT